MRYCDIWPTHKVQKKKKRFAVRSHNDNFATIIHATDLSQQVTPNRM